MKDIKRVNRGSIRRSREIPTTGNGHDGGQKPKLSETNLGSKRGGALRLGGHVLRLVGFGKHRKAQ